MISGTKQSDNDILRSFQHLSEVQVSSFSHGGHHGTTGEGICGIGRTLLRLTFVVVGFSPSLSCPKCVTNRNSTGATSQERNDSRMVCRDEQSKLTDPVASQ